MATATTKPKTIKSSAHYIEAVGRRKRATARVRITEAAKSSYLVEGKDLKGYFGTDDLASIVSAPLLHEGTTKKYHVTVKVSGGGIHAQAEAIRHGISRCLIEIDPTQKKDLKKLGYLKRDSRKVERKHFGLKKARKASQWSKR